MSNCRDEISRFVTGVLEDVEKECQKDILHDNKDLGRFIVHAQQDKESLRRKRGRESEKSRPSHQFGLSNGKNSFGVRDRPKFMKDHKHSGNPTPSNNTNAEKVNDRNAQRDQKTCGKCGLVHVGECMEGFNGCYGCGKSGHVIKD